MQICFVRNNIKYICKVHKKALYFYFAHKAVLTILKLTLIVKIENNYGITVHYLTLFFFSACIFASIMSAALLFIFIFCLICRYFCTSLTFMNEYYTYIFCSNCHKYKYMFFFQYPQFVICKLQVEHSPRKP